MKLLLSLIIALSTQSALAGKPTNCISKCGFGDGGWYTVSCLKKASRSGTKITSHNCSIDLDSQNEDETCTTDKVIYDVTSGSIANAKAQFKRRCAKNNLYMWEDYSEY